MSKKIQLNVDVGKLDLSKVDDKTDRQIRLLALEHRMTYLAAANHLLVNKTLLYYGGAS